MSENFNLIDKQKIAPYLRVTHKHYLDSIIIFNELPSTNLYLLELAKADPACPTCICLAENQTAGKGRLGRQWVSAYAKNILLSLLWCFRKKPDELGGLSIAIAISVIETLQHYGVKAKKSEFEELMVKWPNDVLWRNRKLAGILIESFQRAQHVYNVVIGIGLNVDMPKTLSQNIAQPWCDVAEIITSIPDRNQLIGLLIDQLLVTMTVFQKEGLRPFREKWCKLDISCGQEVVIVTSQKRIFGVGRGIDEKGHFLLEDKLGILHSFAVGEVSLAKEIVN